jgi:hypothetical protein
MSAMSVVAPTARRVIIVLSNRDPPTAQKVPELVATLLNEG